MTATVLQFRRPTLGAHRDQPAWVPGSGICGAGPGPCGAEGARLFPSGWRCELHAGVSHRVVAR